MVYTAISDSSGTVSQFTRRKLVKLTHSGALTAYQKRLTISHMLVMQANFNDIRFVTLSGAHVPYWLESKTDSDTADVWIKNDYLDGDTYVWMYYGNSGLSSGSSGVDTFIQWHGAKSASYWDSNLLTPFTEFIYECSALYDSSAADAFLGCDVDGTWTTEFAFSRYNDGAADLMLYSRDGTTTKLEYATFGIEFNAYHRYKVEKTAAALKMFYDGAQKAATITTNLPDTNLGIGFNILSGSPLVNWAFVRKYTATEPTYTIGAEQHQRRHSQFIN